MMQKQKEMSFMLVKEARDDVSNDGNNAHAALMPVLLEVLFGLGVGGHVGGLVS